LQRAGGTPALQNSCDDNSLVAIFMGKEIKVGILAVQGDFEAHAKTLARMGVDYVFVRTPGDLEGVDAVILPGGESTTQWKFLVEEGLDKSLLQHAARGGAIFGTCAGAILLAREVRNPAQESLGLADITVIRNGYGRQLASEVRHGATAISAEPIEMVFIRAPIIERVGPDVEVLAKSDGQPVLIRHARILIATFHPELTSNTSVHEYFLRMVQLEGNFEGRRNEGSVESKEVRVKAEL
jgi:5'-phosphate synthase pdxT subunit